MKVHYTYTKEPEKEEYFNIYYDIPYIQPLESVPIPPGACEGQAQTQDASASTCIARA